MVCVFTEGFDKYGSPNANTSGAAPTLLILLTQGDWTTITGSTLTIVAGLSATGGALNITSTAAITKTLATNYARLIGGLRFSSTLAAQVLLAQFRDGATAQCTLTLETTGVINLRSGSSAGTILGGGATISANSTHYVEWDITFGASSAYQVWLDGVSLFSGTGNTRGGTANNYANAFNIQGTASAAFTVDDLYLFDTTGTVNNAVLLTSPRIETVFPTSDASVQFTVSAATLGGSIVRHTGTASTAANGFYVKPLTPTRNCTLNSLTFLPNATSGTVNLRGIVYADNAGVPGSLLTSGSTVTGTTAGTPLVLPLTTPQSLTAGTPYWLGLMADIAVTNVLAATDALASGRNATSTFASGAPGTAPATTAGQISYSIWGNITLSSSVNWYEVAGGIAGPPNPGQSYVSDSTVGHEDLYGMTALTTNPVNLYAVATKVYWEKSDAGARTMSVRVKSSATEVASSAIAPGTTYTWAALYNDTDPATSLAWTLTAVNAAQAGFRIET